MARRLFRLALVFAVAISLALAFYIWSYWRTVVVVNASGAAITAGELYVVGKRFQIPALADGENVAFGFKVRDSDYLLRVSWRDGRKGEARMGYVSSPRFISPDPDVLLIGSDKIFQSPRHDPR